jgi:hypothetical protein
MMESQSVQARSNWLEVVAVVGTGFLHLLLKPLGLQAVFVIVAVCAWLVYIVYRTIQKPAILSNWGFRRTALGHAFIVTSLLALAAAALMALFAHATKNFSISRDAWPLFALYPIWGTIQQFLVQGLVVRNLSLKPIALKPLTLVLVGAVLFSMVHVPNLSLTFATFCLGLLFVPVYLRFRNLWPLGLYHGWLGALFYLWVLGRNPWIELFPNFIATY